MGKKDLNGIEVILFILFLPIVAIYFLIAEIVKATEKAHENTEYYVRYGSSSNSFALEEKRRQEREQRRSNRIDRKKEKRSEKLANVARLGKLGNSLDLINQELKFLEVSHKEVVECETLVEYKMFNIKTYFSAHYSELSELFVKLRNNKTKNDEIYKEYKKNFFACNDFTSEEEIKQIPKRGISVKEFKELEREVFEIKIKNHSTAKICIEITVKYKENKKVTEINEFEIEKILKEVKEEREYKFVCANSFIYKELSELNRKYSFYNIKIQDFNIKCNSYNEYQKFDIREYARKRLTMKNGLEVLYNQAKKNEKLYNEYKKQYLNLSQYFRMEKEISEIENLQLSLVEFQIKEKSIYEQMMLKEPVFDFSIYYKVEYTSPAGRNHYEKEECLTKTMIGEILSSIENEELARQEAEVKKELTKQQRAKEQAEMRDLLKNKGKLEQKEADLAQREKEFQQATQGHIYAVSDSPASIEVEQPTIKNAEESLSAWEKMKRLKKTYEDGEITYEEYNEKRKHLT